MTATRRSSAMPQQYDALVDTYARAVDAVSLYRDHVEIPSFLHALGPVRGRNVLDVGCGDGFYTRLVRRRGAARAVGVDVSEGMIGAARAREARRPTGAEYHVHDAATLPVLGSFDVVLATHLLHYAADRETLGAMGERMYANVAPGGRLLAFVGNPDCDEAAAAAAGFRLERPARPREGDAFTVSVLTTPPTVLRVHHWPREALVRVLRSAGFTDITWEPMVSSPPAAENDGARVRRCLDDPVNLLLSAHRR
ncbi:class I SAM-dependent methyltransferase [Streptomyces sp.]|uniref:class I SAM-dependent methyltransferase n=1 Tax=Streptomyces sp. TaxID=1931 RepID=UPI0028119FDC|nr:class I SAM-dependent methyltransferase [Streptomyces sp.]